MKLTESDIAYLKELGETEDEDFAQVEKAAAKTTYTLIDKNSGAKKRIGYKQAIEMLGRETFLSGLDRSAFHWDSIRETIDGKHYVSFDSKAFLKSVLM